MQQPIDTSGLGRFADLLKSIPGRANDAFGRTMDRRMDAFGRAVVADAYRLAPVRTGQLRNSIGYIYRQSDRTVQFHVDVPWGVYQEMGFTHYRSGKHVQNPYLRPAIDKNAGLLTGRIVRTELLFQVDLRPGQAEPTTGAPQTLEYRAAIDLGASKGASRKTKILIRQRPRRLGGPFAA